MNRLALILILVASRAEAHEVISTKITWTREIVRIFANRCFSCHSEASKRAPFSLQTYEEARPWAKAISEEVLERRMPPWSAVKGFGHFSNDAGLSQEEVNLIAEWVEGGAPKGEEKFLPPPTPVSAVSPVRLPGSRMLIRGSLTLPAARTLIGIEVGSLAKDASVMATAELPDGSVEPLLWIRRFDPRAPRVFVLEQPLTLPARTVIRLDGVPVTLVTRAR